MPAPKPLFVMACDHRVALERRFARPEETPGDLYVRFAAAKQLVWEATTRSLATIDGARIGILADEQYGAHVLSQGRRTDGVTVCLPIERSLSELFAYEHGDDFAAHVEAVQPDVLKVLVFHNPGSDPDLLATQAARLATVTSWCDERPYEFMLEVLIPPTDAQLAACGGDRDAYDRQVRPELTLQVVEQLQGAGVAADYWKLEGFTERQHVVDVVAACRANRPSATYVLLGRAAEQAQVNEWLRTAAQVDGAGGFAIGRTIWEGPLASWFAGEIDRSAAVDAVAESFVGYVQSYLAAAGTPVS